MSSNKDSKNKQNISIEKYEAAKKELSDFVYIVSHDLNAPLRHTREFSKLLIQNLGDKITDKDRMYVDFMEKGIRKAEDLLESLLQYSRITTQAEEFKKIDCNELINEVLLNLKQQIEDTGADISVQPLPSIVGDKKQIRQLFFHILDNAMKFCKDGVSPEILVIAAVKDDEVVFSVQDNGIGIPENQHDVVFALFRQLNADSDGTGVGLTIAKKIIELHGGKIWIESIQDEMCKLNFSIPTT